MTSSTDDLDTSAKTYEQAAELHLCPPSDRIVSASEAGRLRYSQNLLEPTYKMLTTAMRLLPGINPRVLYRNDQQVALSRVAGIAADAAAISIRTGKNITESIQFLELGRGVMASTHLEMCSDIAELKETHPVLAEMFERVRDELDLRQHDSGLNDNESRQYRSRITRRLEASTEFEEQLALIRSQDKFTNFLQGPSSNRLKPLAASGPIRNGMWCVPNHS